MKILISGDVLVTRFKSNLVSDDLRQIITSADLAICNLEGPLDSEGKPIRKAGPHVHQHPNALNLIKAAGFGYCSLANNHIYDYGDHGLLKTLDTASSIGLRVFGAGLSWGRAYGMAIHEAEETTVGMLAFCEAEFGCLLEDRGRGGYAYVNHGEVCRLIFEAKRKVDFLLVIVHAGVEDLSLPLPEWRMRYRQLCDDGADAVVGHHPHVPQGWEMYRGKPIFYSCGNFHFDSDLMKDSSDDAYSVVFEIVDKVLKKIDIIGHRKEAGCTTLITDAGFKEKLDHLCQILGPPYEGEVNRQILSLYESRYKPYFLRALSGMDQESRFFHRCARALKLLFLPPLSTLEREMLLLHNIRIDSHRYLVQRALSLRWENE